MLHPSDDFDLLVFVRQVLIVVLTILLKGGILLIFSEHLLDKFIGSFLSLFWTQILRVRCPVLACHADSLGLILGTAFRLWASRLRVFVVFLES